MTFTNRWQHQMTLTFRAWPREARAHKLSVMATEWSVDGMTFNCNERLEVVHRLGKKGFAAWELSVEDADTLMAAGAAGAKIGKMRLRCPGSMDSIARKACWLDVEVTVYPKTKARGVHVGRYEVACPEDELAATTLRLLPSYEAVELYRRPRQIDVAEIAGHILAGKVVVFNGRTVSAATVNKLRERLNYYTIEGRKPDEVGGLFCGYQLGDGVTRWRNVYRPEERAREMAENMRKMHMSTRAKGQANRRTYFVEAVTERIAKRYGISRQRVMSGFLRYGIVDYLIRSYEAAVAAGELHVHSQPSIDLAGFVTKATRVVSFIVDGLTEKEAE